MIWFEYRCTCGVLICALSQEKLDAAIKRHRCKGEEMKQPDEQYEEIARCDRKGKIYQDCDAEDAKREMFGDDSEYLDDDMGDK
jgi:hypothetical protein